MGGGGKLEHWWLRWVICLGLGLGFTEHWRAWRESLPEKTTINNKLNLQSTMGSGFQTKTHR